MKLIYAKEPPTNNNSNIRKNCNNNQIANYKKKKKKNNCRMDHLKPANGLILKPNWASCSESPDQIY
jgi:hypothetical protein